MTTDPLTWLELFRWYDMDEHFAYAGFTPITSPQDHDEDMWLLQRRHTPRFGQPLLLGEKDLHLGERWENPTTSGALLLLQADFRLRTVGSLRDVCFKNYPPEMMVEYQNGLKKNYRLVWRNAASGFVVSDLPTDPSQMTSLWREGGGSPVKAITLNANEKRFKSVVPIRWLKVPFIH